MAIFKLNNISESSKQPNKPRLAAYRRIAMVRPNKDFVYALSRIKTEIVYMDMDNLPPGKMAHSISLKVSFEPDGVSNPQRRKAYAINGLDCYYIRDGRGER